MQLLKETWRAFRPMIWVLWAVAAVRLAMDAIAEDDKTAFMMSVYASSGVLFLYTGITGAMDHVGWKRLLVGCLMLAVLCWCIPNGIAYTVAQFQGWAHGRFFADVEEYELLERFEAEGMSTFEAMDAVREELGHFETRFEPQKETTGGRLAVAWTTAGLTAIAGAVWCLGFGILLLGIPMSLRRRRE